MFDDLISGGLIIDGTGEARFRADLAIKDGKIAALGNLTGAKAGRVIDASGKLVTPGFLEICSGAYCSITPEQCNEALLLGITTVAAECAEPAELPCGTEEIFPVNVVLLSELPAAEDPEEADDEMPEAAVRERTAVSALRLGLTGKGKLIPGLDADLCVLSSSEAVGRPDLVMVNGVIAVEAGTLTGCKSGKLIQG